MAASSLEEVARQAVAAIGAGDDYLVAIRWAYNRWIEVLGEARFPQVRAIGTISLPAFVDDGAADATRGSATIALDATAAAAATAASVDNSGLWYIRVGTVWYKITAYVSPNITIEALYAEDTVTSNVYTIVKRYHPLAATAKWLGTFYHPRSRRAFPKILPAGDIDLYDASRAVVGGYPLVVLEAGYYTASAVRMVEVYPPSGVSEVMFYHYWEEPVYSASLAIPSFVDPEILKEGVLIDLMRWKMSEALKLGQVAVAGHWRNEYRAQETRWKDEWKPRLIRAAKGDVDNMTIALDWAGGSRGTAVGAGDVRTAQDQVEHAWVPLS